MKTTASARNSREARPISSVVFRRINSEKVNFKSRESKKFKLVNLARIQIVRSFVKLAKQIPEETASNKCLKKRENLVSFSISQIEFAELTHILISAEESGKIGRAAFRLLLREDFRRRRMHERIQQRLHLQSTSLNSTLFSLFIILTNSCINSLCRII